MNKDLNSNRHFILQTLKLTLFSLQETSGSLWPTIPLHSNLRSWGGPDLAGPSGRWFPCQVQEGAAAQRFSGKCSALSWVSSMVGECRMGEPCANCPCCWPKGRRMGATILMNCPLYQQHESLTATSCPGVSIPSSQSAWPVQGCAMPSFHPSFLQQLPTDCKVAPPRYFPLQRQYSLLLRHFH